MESCSFEVDFLVDRVLLFSPSVLIDVCSRRVLVIMIHEFFTLSSVRFPLFIQINFPEIEGRSQRSQTYYVNEDNGHRDKRALATERFVIFKREWRVPTADLAPSSLSLQPTHSHYVLKLNSEANHLWSPPFLHNSPKWFHCAVHWIISHQRKLDKIKRNSKEESVAIKAEDFFPFFFYLLSFDNSENDGEVTTRLHANPPVTKIVNRN